MKYVHVGDSRYLPSTKIYRPHYILEKSMTTECYLGSSNSVFYIQLLFANVSQFLNFSK